jgi:AcrR family transcriptional regulator
VPVDASVEALAPRRDAVLSTSLDKNSAHMRRPRGSISAEAILRGTYELAAAQSLDFLSFPRISRSLDVGMSSIYWYFRSKEELVDAMTVRAMTEFDRGLDIAPDLPWEECIRAFFRQSRDILRGNDLLCDLLVMRAGAYPPEAVRVASARVDSVLAVLVGAGFSADAAAYAFKALSIYVRGALFLERCSSASSHAELATASTSETSPGVPVLTVVRQQPMLSMVGDACFEFGLENCIRGLLLHLDDQ